ncbi:nucleoside/nucleotide kinase family protein [Methanobacterium paludis]|uniref:Thymidylate kinase n=1 Tax=Methanobacterium paludis (strain DSM 25820 / JCM 18151 / SWAN1) TaxID=868131 RepID=F6D5D9_METPW|nr:thymidylate kinase [Methanobacterium paludis]AEG18880.1 thymidylate kinase [Methanobacterium paludis]
MRFIVLDGPLGSGKATHSKLIRDKYLAKGEKVILRSHPSQDGKYGIKAKNALIKTGPLNKIKAPIYYTLDFIQSAQTYYGGVDTVIFVRYLMNLAYLPMPLAKIMYWIFTAFLPVSEYMFFLDLTPEESMKRMSGQEDQEEMFKMLEDLIKVRGKALELANEWHVINTSGTIEEVQNEIDEIIERLDSRVR